jgi:hypothetical protein
VRAREHDSYLVEGLLTLRKSLHPCIPPKNIQINKQLMNINQGPQARRFSLHIPNRQKVCNAEELCGGINLTLETHYGTVLYVPLLSLRRKGDDVNSRI